MTRTRIAVMIVANLASGAGPGGPAGCRAGRVSMHYRGHRAKEEHA